MKPEYVGIVVVSIWLFGLAVVMNADRQHVQKNCTARMVAESDTHQAIIEYSICSEVPSLPRIIGLYQIAPTKK